MQIQQSQNANSRHGRLQRLHYLRLAVLVVRALITYFIIVKLIRGVVRIVVKGQAIVIPIRESTSLLDVWLIAHKQYEAINHHHGFTHHLKN